VTGATNTSGDGRHLRDGVAGRWREQLALGTPGRGLRVVPARRPPRPAAARFMGTQDSRAWRRRYLHGEEFGGCWPRPAPSASPRFITAGRPARGASCIHPGVGTPRGPTARHLSKPPPTGPGGRAAERVSESPPLIRWNQVRPFPLPSPCSPSPTLLHLSILSPLEVPTPFSHRHTFRLQRQVQRHLRARVSPALRTGQYEAGQAQDVLGHRNGGSSSRFPPRATGAAGRTPSRRSPYSEAKTVPPPWVCMAAYAAAMAASAPRIWPCRRFARPARPECWPAGLRIISAAARCTIFARASGWATPWWGAGSRVPHLALTGAYRAAVGRDVAGAPHALRATGDPFGVSAVEKTWRRPSPAWQISARARIQGRRRNAAC